MNIYMHIYKLCVHYINIKMMMAQTVFIYSKYDRLVEVGRIFISSVYISPESTQTDTFI